MIQNCFNDDTNNIEARLLPGPGSPPAQRTKPSDYSLEFKEQCATSIIRLEHPFVIAGGRFREQYYWDSFFVMEGLLAANMTYLARTTLLNFMDEIRSYGFIPNGGRYELFMGRVGSCSPPNRKYYLNRSQPPLFIHVRVFIPRTFRGITLH